MCAKLWSRPDFRLHSQVSVCLFSFKYSSIFNACLTNACTHQSSVCIWQLLVLSSLQWISDQLLVLNSPQCGFDPLRVLNSIHFVSYQLFLLQLLLKVCLTSCWYSALLYFFLIGCWRLFLLKVWLSDSLYSLIFFSVSPTSGSLQCPSDLLLGLTYLLCLSD